MRKDLGQQFQVGLDPDIPRNAQNVKAQRIRRTSGSL